MQSNFGASSVNDRELLVERLLTASRVLLAVTARSLVALGDELTIPQFRALVILSSQGSRTMGELAAALDVHPSTATRMCGRLAAKELVERTMSRTSRREVDVSLTARGRELVQKVTRRRRREISKIVEAMDPHRLEDVITGLHEFATAAGESPVATGEWLA